MACLMKIGKVYYSNLRINGKRIRIALSTDQRFALQKLADLMKEQKAAKYGEALRGISWQAFKERYMAYSASKAPKTHYLDKLAFRKLEEAMPLVRLDSLTPERLEMFKGILQKSGNAITSVNRKLRAIKAAINKAIEWNLLAPDTAYKRVKYFKEPKGRLHFFSLEETKIILSICRGVWKTIAMLGYYAGLRREEIHSLKNECLDFERDRIHIEPSEDFTPKDYERRFIPMHPELKGYLKRLQRTGIYVLGNNRPSLDVMTVYFTKILRKAKLSGSLHKLRHTFGSHCAMQGVDARVLQRWMGHSKLETTQIYSHLSPEHLDQGISRLPGI